MAEKEYIEQKTAFEMITDLAGSATTKSTYAAIWECAWTVKDIPAADVVEVVRCKDCVHKNPYNRYEFHCKCLRDNLHHNTDDYCSYGERKEAVDDKQEA